MSYESFYIINTGTSLSVEVDFKGYLIVYKKNKDDEIANAQLQLLKRLIENGLKLKMENFLFIDVANQQSRFSVWRKQIEINKCIFFGVEPSEVGLNFNLPSYKNTTFSSILFLKADAPEVLEKNSALKAKLWEQLQLAFNS
ncbi:MAG: hypothetical protein R2739_08405 [Chitinophagales bacterium]